MVPRSSRKEREKKAQTLNEIKQKNKTDKNKKCSTRTKKG